MLKMIEDLALAGLLALRDYIAFHTLTCLIPAFLLASGMVSFVNKEAILRHLGQSASKPKSFALASLFSIFIASCSCTVLPVASGLYFAGAGIGAAFIVLWVAPSANMLSLLYTFNLLGWQMALARIVGSLSMAFIVGFVMSAVFGRKDVRSNTLKQEEVSGKFIEWRYLVLLALILLSILLPNYIAQGRSYLTHGAVWFGVTVLWVIFASASISKEDIKRWLRETWWFVRMILPLLLGGVMVVGIISKLLPKEVVSHGVGGSGILASFIATLSGQILYFGTLTESPFIAAMLKLGMGKGPALAFLLTGPGMSLPSMLAIGRIFGPLKAAVYVLLIMFLGTILGWFCGNFVL